jgi:hypothetical protein
MNHNESQSDGRIVLSDQNHRHADNGCALGQLALGTAKLRDSNHAGA